MRTFPPSGQAGGFCRDRLIELWEKSPTGGSVSGVILGCLIRKACGTRCSGEVIPARSHLEAWVDIWVRSAGLGLVLAGWLLLGANRETPLLFIFFILWLLIFGQEGELHWCFEMLSFFSFAVVINVS